MAVPRFDYAEVVRIDKGHEEVVGITNFVGPVGEVDLRHRHVALFPDERNAVSFVSMALRSYVITSTSGGGAILSTNLRAVLGPDPVSHVEPAVVQFSHPIARPRPGPDRGRSLPHTMARSVSIGWWFLVALSIDRHSSSRHSLPRRSVPIAARRRSMPAQGFSFAGDRPPMACPAGYRMDEL